MPTLLDSKSNYYVLYVTTGKEEYICNIIKKRFGPHVFEPFTFKKNVSIKKGNKYKKITKALFPGYIIIKSPLPEIYFIEEIICFVRNTNDIIKILNYGTSEKIAVNEEEIACFLSLCNRDYCIEYSKGLIEGDTVIIIDGPLMGYESKIIGINKQKHKVSVELVMMAELRTVTLELELIRKVD